MDTLSTGTPSSGALACPAKCQGRGSLFPLTEHDGEAFAHFPKGSKNAAAAFPGWKELGTGPKSLACIRPGLLFATPPLVRNLPAPAPRMISWYKERVPHLYRAHPCKWPSNAVDLSVVRIFLSAGQYGFGLVLVGWHLWGTYLVVYPSPPPLSLPYIPHYPRKIKHKDSMWKWSWTLCSGTLIRAGKRTCRSGLVGRRKYSDWLLF